MLQLVNAVVSHEMRNPLNSIIAHTYNLRELARRIKEEFKNQIENQEQVNILDEFLETVTIQESCTKLLSFYVADLLCLSQIEKGTLRKNFGRFKLKEAIDEIITVQK